LKSEIQTQKFHIDSSTNPRAKLNKILKEKKNRKTTNQKALSGRLYEIFGVKSETALEVGKE